MDRYFTDNGIILKAEPIGEYDRRLVILTKDHGKISAFARGARRPHSKLMAVSDYFVFGSFKIYASANSYVFADADVINYFDDLRSDFAKAMYGLYFLEVTDFLCKDNNDEEEMLILLYQALRALLHDGYNNDFVKIVFELKAMMLSGEFENVDPNKYLSGTVYTLDYLYYNEAKKTYSFTVKDEIFAEMKTIAAFRKKKLWNHTFNSEDLLITVEN